MTLTKLAKILVVFYVLACVELFSATFLPLNHTTYKAIQCGVFFPLAILLLKKRINKNEFSLPFFLIIGSMVISSFMASTMHEQQSIVESIRATLPRMMAYSSFFLLCQIKPDTQYTEKLMLILGFISAILTIQIWILFPNPFFGEVFIHPVRGIRMIVSGDTFKICLLFYCINTLLIRHSKKAIFLLIICIISVILGIARQIMLITAGLSVLFAFRKFGLIKRIFLALAVVLSFQIITTMKFYKDSVAYTHVESEKFKGGENIRVTAAKYFINSSQVNVLTRIFGNGCFAETSAYGAEFLRKEKKNSCYPTDVGIAYFYHIYGLLGIAGLFFIGYRTVKIKLPFRYQYLKYSMFYMLLVSIASGPILYYQQCIIIPFLCYQMSQVKKAHNLDQTNERLEIQ